LAGAASIGAAVSLVVLVRLAARGVFQAHTQWMNAMYIFGTLAACAFVCACAILCRAPRVLLCAPCLLALAFLQAQELNQDALHRHGRTEHVQVQQIQQSSDGGLGGTSTRYIVSVLDGPPIEPIPENGFKPWNWAPGGTYTLTVDPQQRADPMPGGRPGPPVILRLLHIPLGLGLAYALRQPADHLLRRRRAGEARMGAGSHSDAVPDFEPGTAPPPPTAPHRPAPGR
jgi:hypothetical protein